MDASLSRFTFGSADQLGIKDTELEQLLIEVYIGGGFTPAEEASQLFNPTAVRQRGLLLAMLDKKESVLAGFIIVVPPNSPSIRIAQQDEAELHLLGVLPKYRGQGLGGRLVAAAIDEAIGLGCKKLVLWTQVTMKDAQRLYERAGFFYVRDMSKNGRDFKVYERICAS